MATGLHFVSPGNCCGAVLLLVLVAGCGSQPPSVKTTVAVKRLDPSARSISARELPDDDVGSLERLKQLEILDFSRGWGVGPARITDDGLATLATLDLPKLETLTLGWCQNITDDGLRHVAKLKTITWLGLPACSNITDAGLPSLAESKNLKSLDLRGNPNITDEGIQQLAAKKDWKEISLGGCQHVTAKGVTRLQTALPNTRVEKDDQEWQWINTD